MSLRIETDPINDAIKQQPHLITTFYSQFTKILFSQQQQQKQQIYYRLKTIKIINFEESH